MTNFKLIQLDTSLYNNLDDEDKCLYIGEYTSGASYVGDENNPQNFNQQIYNLKKYPSDITNNPRLVQYKNQAIKYIAEIIRNGIKSDVLKNRITLVPIPPSKLPDNPDYDDRMFNVCNSIVNADVIKLISITQTLTASHESNTRPSADEIYNNLKISENIPPNYIPREIIVLIDDVLTTGSHFKACKKLLNEKYEQSKVIGIFAAKTVHRNNIEDDFKGFFTPPYPFT